MIAIECKSGYDNRLYVPRDQIVRCQEWSQNFNMYNPVALLAFKFAANGKRKLKYVYKEVPQDEAPDKHYSCDYEGVIRDEENTVIPLKDFEVPWS